MSLRDNYLRLTARTGKLIRSDGSILNEADFLALEAESDAAKASREGILYRAFWDQTIPAGATRNLILVIPSGVRVHGITRAQTISPGSVDVGFYVGGAYTTVENSLLGYNFDETSGQANRGLCAIANATDLTGESQRTSSFKESPTQNSRASSSSQTEAGAQPVFNETYFPVFKYTNTGADPIRLAVNLIWQETVIT